MVHGRAAETLARSRPLTHQPAPGQRASAKGFRRLAQAQLAFVSAGGPPVTQEVWDRLTATFANALREHSVLRERSSQNFVILRQGVVTRRVWSVKSTVRPPASTLTTRPTP